MSIRKFKLVSGSFIKSLEFLGGFVVLGAIVCWCAGCSHTSVSFLSTKHVRMVLYKMLLRAQIFCDTNRARGALLMCLVLSHLIVLGFLCSV